MPLSRDRRWSTSVALLAKGKCPHCGKLVHDVHHIMPRNCQRTRYLIENGINCCFILHRMFEGKWGKTKEERMINKEKAIRIYVGKERFNNLNKIRRGIIQYEEVGYREVS